MATTFVLVHVPPPWPRNVGEIDALGSLADVGRVQLVWSRNHRRTSSSSVLVECYAASDPSEPRLGYASHRAPWSALPEMGADLAIRAREADPRRSPLQLLVCSHGTRDRCCGSLGTRLAHSDATSAEVVLRSSHLGGHRFAPTVLSLPDGRYWAFADQLLLQALVDRADLTPDMLRRYRGRALMPSSALQLAEAVAFEALGWALDACSLDVSEDDEAVRLLARNATGGGLEVRATASAPRRVEVPACTNGGAATTHLDQQLKDTMTRWW